MVTKDHAGNAQAIPLPATALREISEELAKQGMFTARLVSASPLNPDNAPKTQFEKAALEAIMAGAESYGRVEEGDGGPVYLKAVPDKVTTTACLGCHQGRQLGDVLGILSVSIPVGDVYEASAASVRRIGLAILAVVVVLGLVIFAAFKLMVVRPLATIEAVSRDIAGGDLTVAVPVNGRDEIGELSERVNGLADALRSTIGQVAQVTDRMVSASVQLAATADQMRKGADNLMGRMAQTATAVEEMTATVGEVAQNSGGGGRSRAGNG